MCSRDIISGELPLSAIARCAALLIFIARGGNEQ